MDNACSTPGCTGIAGNPKIPYCGPCYDARAAPGWEREKQRQARMPRVGRDPAPKRPDFFGAPIAPEKVKRHYAKPEKSTADAIEDALKAAGLWVSQIIDDPSMLRGVTLYSNPVGQAMVGATGRISYGLAVGSGDKIGYLVPSGRMVSIETKGTDGRTAEHQLRWAKRVGLAGPLTMIIGKRVSPEEAGRMVVEEIRKALAIAGRVP